ncbi:MAG: PA0069 family radical SAM protein [Burkholderiaceae bacterium]|nr:PA0069 family radical SAM protein [Burkholderiaceae bacterium]
MNTVSAPPRGRGATFNPHHRFAALRGEPVDDGWYHEDGEPPALATEVREERARSLVVRNQSPDLHFGLSINPYRGCEHGCIYCYARPNHGYVGLSPGLDFESRLFVKVDAAERLRAELDAPGWKCEPINLGSTTDAYQPIERRYGLTRALIEVMAARRQPFAIVTKSSLVERDIDLLAPLAADRLVGVYVTVTTLDADLVRHWEPRAAAPWRRLQTMRRLREAGIPVGVSLAPVAPFLNEPEIERVLAAASEAGAQAAFYQVLRLPWELRELFVQWLGTRYPDRARRVLRRLADMRSDEGRARLNDPRFFSRMTGQGAWAELIRLRFELAARRLGLARRLPELRADLFRRGADERQLGLF